MYASEVAPIVLADLLDRRVEAIISSGSARSMP
jgi:hypothetical protein